MEKRGRGRPKNEESPVGWRRMVRLPDELGREVEDLATEEMMPVAVMLRHLVRDGVKYRKGRRRGQ